MTEHTPAPWVSSTQKGPPKNCLVAQVFDANGDCIATIEPTENPDDADALAELIARAPDLLAENTRLREVNARLVEALKLSRDRVKAHEGDNYGNDPLAELITAALRAAEEGP